MERRRESIKLVNCADLQGSEKIPHAANGDSAMIYLSGDTEAVRLTRAFNKIDDPETRRLILELVEAAAMGAAIKVKESEEIVH
jgi:hypothetical protein